MAALIARPGVADFLDEVMHANNLELLIDQVKILASSTLVGQTVGEANLRARLGITVLALQEPGGTIDTSPGASTPLQAGSLLVAMGTRDQLHSLVILAQPQQSLLTQDNGHSV
jgi:voltage-gated potassium channel